MFFSLNWTSSRMLFTLGKGLICPETIFCLFLWRMEGLRVHLHVASLSSLRGLQQGCSSNMRENATLKECVCHLVRCLEILSGTSASVVGLFSQGFYCLKKKSVFVFYQSFWISLQHCYLNMHFKTLLLNLLTLWSYTTFFVKVVLLDGSFAY